MDLAQTEAADAELVRMIERRSRKGEVDPDELEPSYMESVRQYNAQRREEIRAAWASYHEGQAARHRVTLQALVEHHEAEAEKYLPKGAYGEPSTAPRQRLPGQGGNARAYEIP